MTQDKVVVLSREEIECLVLALERMEKEIENDNDSFMNALRAMIQSILRVLKEL